MNARRLQTRRAKFAALGVLAVVTAFVVVMAAANRPRNEAPGAELLNATPSSGRVALSSGTATVVSAMDTVRPADNPVGSVGADLVSARREFESFQIVVRAGASNLTAVDVAGVIGGIPASWFTFYYEDYYTASTQSDNEGGTGKLPDALVPKKDYMYGETRNRFPFTVPATENRVIWVDVGVPAGQAAGTYQGSISLLGGGSSAAVPVTVTVLNLDLPATSTLSTAFFTEYYRPCLAHTGDKLCRGNDEQRWSLQALYARVALENRVTIANPWPLGVNQSPPAIGTPWRPYYDRYFLPLVKGTALVDSAAKWSPLRISGARLTTVAVYWDCLTSGTCLADWKAEAAASGFADRLVFYSCDEVPSATCPDWTTFKSRATAANASAPSVPILVTATINDANANSATNLIDLIVPNVERMDDKSNGKPGYAGNQRANYDSFLATAGNRLWSYSSCLSFGCGTGTSPETYWDGWPGYAIDAPGSQHTAMGWLAYIYRWSGELYYNTMQSLDHAWGDQFFDGANGDGNLFYPGRACSTATDPSCIGGSAGTDIPIETIRLKRIRDGSQVYEWLSWLGAHGKSTEALSIAKSVFASAHDTTVAAATIDNGRRQLASLITSIVGPSPAPSSTASPTPSPTASSTPSPTPLPVVPETTLTAKPASPTNATTASFSFTASDPSATFACSLDGAAFATCTSPLSYTGITEGSHVFAVRARNAAGTDPTPAQANWLVDRTAPAATAPVQTIAMGSTLTRIDLNTVTVPLTLTWSAIEAGSGVKSYELQWSTNKGATWTSLGLSSPTAQSAVVAVSPTVTYTFRVRATDKANNVGAWSTGPNLLVAGYQESHAALTYRGSIAWSPGSFTSFWGGADRYSSKQSNSVTFAAGNVRSVAWISSTDSTHGKASIYLDGSTTAAATIDLYAPTGAGQFRYVAWSMTFATAGNHTVKVVVLGTSGRPRVDVDAFVALHDQL